MNYIIINNNETDKAIIKTIINNIMFNHNIEYQIFEFSKNKSIYKQLEFNDIYKVYIIDISEDSQNFSINLAKHIRDNDPKSDIIFLDSSNILLETIYNAIRKVYCTIPKLPDMFDKLKIELTNIVNQYYHSNLFFPLDSKRSIEISLDNILYIYRETKERKLYLVTENNKIPVNINLKDALNYCDINFKQIQKGCIVNKPKVSLYNWNDGYFVLKNGQKIYMCSKKYRDV